MQQSLQEKQQQNRLESVPEEWQGTRRKLCKKSSNKLVNNISKNVERNQEDRAQKQIWNMQKIMQKGSN